MAQDLYAALGVPRNASKQAIKKAYRKLARELHPDRNPGDRAAEDRFKKVSYAFEVLTDDRKKALYDEFGEVGLREGFDPEMVRQRKAAGGRNWANAFEDLFRGAQPGAGAFDLEDLLGGTAPGRRGRYPRGGDLESEIEIDFRDALRGTQRTLTFTAPGLPGGEPSITVRIPAGVQDGERVRLKGQGQTGPGGRGERGDLVLTVHIKPHPHYWREGQDLYTRVPVSPLEAYRGGKIRVPTLDGTVALTVPSGATSETKLRLKGKGVKRGKSQGDLYVHLAVTLPPPGNPETEALLEKLEDQFEALPRKNFKL